MSLNMDRIKEMYEKEINNKREHDNRYAEIVDEGETRVRLLPPKTSAEDFFFATRFHRIDDKIYICPKAYNHSRCPICEKVTKLYKSKDPSDIELASKIYAKKRYYYNVIVRSKEEEGPKVLITGVKLLDKFLTAMKNPDIGDMTHPETGYDFIIIKKRKGEFPNYDDSECARKQSKLSDDPAKAKQWIESQHDLKSLINITSYDDLKKALDEYLVFDQDAVVETAEIVESKNKIHSIGATPVIPMVSTTTVTGATNVLAATPQLKVPQDDKELADFLSTLNKMKEANNG